jgi:hypothetical protein
LGLGAWGLRFGDIAESMATFAWFQSKHETGTLASYLKPKILGASVDPLLDHSPLRFSGLGSGFRVSGEGFIQASGVTQDFKLRVEIV